MKPDKKRQSQQAFDQQAATYDTAIQGSHARTLYPYMLQEITCAWGDRVLDLGCGTGALTAQVLEQDPRRQVTGLDLSEQMLAQARARLGDRVKLIQGDSECRIRVLTWSIAATPSTTIPTRQRCWRRWAGCWYPAASFSWGTSGCPCRGGC